MYLKAIIMFQLSYLLSSLILSSFVTDHVL